MRAILSLALFCAAATAQAQGSGFRTQAESCSRDPVELMWELSAALDAADVNRVAALYDWNGMRSRASRGIMDRLEALSQRTLLQVVPVYPAIALDPSADLLSPWPPADAVPVALRVEQLEMEPLAPATYARSSALVSTTFALRRRMGCWWLAL